jgi:hypothetical protein
MPRPAGFLAIAALLTAAHIRPAQHNHTAQAPSGENAIDPIQLFPQALGKFTRPISSSSREAQAYFDQGFQLMYAFDKTDAIRSFREAEKRDPACAICYWGEAWSWGSFLNGIMQPHESPFAFAAIQKARELASGGTSPTERALIDAMSVRYVEHFDPSKKLQQDLAYAEAMRKVYERFPGDPDVGTSTVKRFSC